MKIQRLLLSFALMVATHAGAQQTPGDRTFRQPKAAVEKALRSIQPTSGRLPTLSGFADPQAGRNIEAYSRGYYQAKVTVESDPIGGCKVHVTAKISAWLADANPSRSGYQELTSNGRIESDVLDRLDQALQQQTQQAGSAPASKNRDASAAPEAAKSGTDSSTPALSAPVPQMPSSELNRSANKTPATANREENALATEARNLEEILRTQSHPANLCAVKKGGAPVLASPSEGAKLLFTAAPEDEFEILDTNVSWIHVRISGLQRGWIRRANVEMPGEMAAESAPPSVAQTSASQFRQVNQVTAKFPGDWEPLRGRQVEIVSVQPAVEGASSGWRARRDYAGEVFTEKYAAMSPAAGIPAGVVLMFDSEDGGMVATTTINLRLWRSGSISEQEFWTRCYFDPPETFGSGQ